MNVKEIIILKTPPTSPTITGKSRAKYVCVKHVSASLRKPVPPKAKQQKDEFLRTNL